MLKEQARLSTHLSTKIPLAEEKGISWRETWGGGDEQARNSRTSHGLGRAGWGPSPGSSAAQLSPLWATWSCQACLTSWRGPWSTPNHEAPKPSACSANPWRHSVPSSCALLHATGQLLPPVYCLGGSGSVPTPSPRGRDGSCCSLPRNAQGYLTRPQSGKWFLPK